MRFPLSFFQTLMLVVIGGGLTYHFKFREEPEATGDPRSAHTRAAPEAEPEEPSYLAPEEPKAMSLLSPEGKPAIVNALLTKVTEAVGKEEPVDPYAEDREALRSLADKDPELHRLLEENFQATFLRKGEFSFTRRKNGETSNAIQLSGLELAAPIHANLTEEEKESGIVERVYYPVRVSAWREYSEGIWGDWRESKPPLLSGFSFQREQDEWKLDASPAQWYSLH